MIVTKVYTSGGDLLRVYPDAFAEVGDKCSYVWESAMARDRWERDPDGYLKDARNRNINTGNWIACISGPAIIIEERQDENNASVRGGDANS